MSSSIGFIIIFLFIIFKKYNSVLKGKRKKVSLTSLAIVPLLFIYMTFESFQNSKLQLSHSYIMLSSMIISLIIGIIIGIIRSKFNILELDKSTGDIYSKTSMTGLFIFIGLLVIKIIFRIAFGFASHNIFTIINDSLLVLTIATLFTTRIVSIIQYLMLSNSYTA